MRGDIPCLDTPATEKLFPGTEVCLTAAHTSHSNSFKVADRLALGGDVPDRPVGACLPCWTRLWQAGDAPSFQSDKLTFFPSTHRIQMQGFTELSLLWQDLAGAGGVVGSTGTGGNPPGYHHRGPGRPQASAQGSANRAFQIRSPEPTVARTLERRSLQFSSLPGLYSPWRRLPYSLKKFRDELKQFLSANNLIPMPMFPGTPDAWVRFIHLYAAVIDECHLQWRDEGLIERVTIHLQMPKEKPGPEWQDRVLFAIWWTCHGKDGLSGDHDVYFGYSPDG